MSDTNEISKGCLTHYDNRHIQVRLDFLGLCAYDKDLFDEKRKEEPNQECMAKILRLFETLTDHARTGWQLKAINAKEKGLTVPQEPKEYRFELTNGAIISLIYNTFGESTVRNSLDYLIHLGYIGRYQEKKNSIPVYWLNTQKLQPLLKEQAENELSGFEITPQTTKGLKSHPKRPKSNPGPTISNPSTPKSDTSGFESTDNNISNNKDNITEKERNEGEIPSNIPDTHTFVSSDTAHAEYSLITFADCLTYLQEQGVAPQGEDAVEIMVQARTLYASRYPLQDEEMFTDEEPQGDDHATAASGHSHRMGEPATADVGHSHHDQNGARLVVPDTRSGLEAQEKITEGEHHANRVPTVPATDYPAASERAVSRPGSDHSRRPSVPANGLPAVRPVGSGTPGQEARGDARDAGRDTTQTLEQTPTTPMPAQPLSLPQAEQAALGTKWNAQTMVAKAEELRGRQFSENARPKEVNAAGKLFKRKADLTQEDFEKAWKLWDTQWWHDNNGLFSLTDLAAVPKNKSEMRLIIALEKLERAKPSLFSVPTKQSTFVPRQSKIEVPDDFIQSAYSYR